MKKVFSNSEVPHIWAQQTQNGGRGSNIFFEGATIYSYGKHFPMATIEGNDVFFTKQRYSNSTGKHLSRTWQAVSHKNIINVWEVPVKNYGDNSPLKKQNNFLAHEANTKHWKENIITLISEIGNKKNRNIESRINGIALNIQELTIYNEYFGLKIKDKELIAAIKLTQSKDFLQAARVAGEKKEAAKEKN